MSIDLAPFGFTPTENLAYDALLSLGPSSGYAVGREIGVARANAYQALDGLVQKGAAARVSEQPRRYRAVLPQGLFALIAEREAGKLDALARQVEESRTAGAETIVPVSGRRALIQLATRTAVRTREALRGAGPAGLLEELTPAWRARAADDRETLLWSLGAPADIPVPIEGEIPADAVPQGGPGFLLVTPDTAVIANRDADDPTGYWTSDTVLVSLAGLALTELTG